MARIFGGILRFKLLVEITGKDRRNFPDHIKVEPQMISLLENFVYLPTISWIQNLSRTFAKLQAGSIHLYLLYVCVTLVILMLVGTRL
jgi:hydrogenase-4 component B